MLTKHYGKYIRHYITCNTLVPLKSLGNPAGYPVFLEKGGEVGLASACDQRQADVLLVSKSDGLLSQDAEESLSVRCQLVTILVL